MPPMRDQWVAVPVCLLICAMNTASCVWVIPGKILLFVNLWTLDLCHHLVFMIDDGFLTRVQGVKGEVRVLLSAAVVYVVVWMIPLSLTPIFSPSLSPPILSDFSSRLQCACELFVSEPCLCKVYSPWKRGSRENGRQIPGERDDCECVWVFV